MSQATQNPNETSSFESEAAVVLQELRPALAGILECLRPPVERATDLRRLLSLDSHLSWSIFNAAHAHDASAVASFIPGRRPMERFLGAAAIHGVPEAAIERARAAFDRFEESVAKHAGTRDAFEAMVAGIGPEGEEGQPKIPAEAKHKRNMFRTASLLYGRQVRVCFCSIIVHSSSAARDGVLDTVMVKGMIGLHQKRRGAPRRPLHTIARRQYKPDRGDPGGPISVEAIDPRESAPDAAGLLRDFCSEPLPTFTSVNAEGFTSHELTVEGIGASAEVTYFTGHAFRACAVRPDTVPGSEISLIKIIDTPTVVYIGDVLLHESVWDDQLPAVNVYDFPLDSPPGVFRDADLLPFSEQAIHLGRGLDSGKTPLVPRYVEMFSYTMGQVGWNPEEFRVFRCRVDHPLRLSRIRMRFQR